MLVFFFFFFTIFITTTTSLMEAYSDSSSNHQMGWVSTTTSRSSSSSKLSRCQGSMVGDCENDEMDSEISRRILATTKYISYESIKKNSVPCSLKGASYYNCKPGAQANPYTRGCSAITKCRS
ncbi:hypothetical protein MKW98_020314 [Papaver atlanticum]|uniref:Rapid ALkalinization Factor n=1 Tax=Papaver atlanticum TaxID=357466 RepID=A0AAD4TDY7_9MAGN|nr:hypothetical protein MKW98_020314 [Papaver atlanticum]